MYIALLNPQGNFDPLDSFWGRHPDFGGQLVYVKELALALAARGHHVDILTRRIEDIDWPHFADPLDAYPGHPGVRIVRVACGPPHFLPKQELWPFLGEWVDNILALYQAEGVVPDFLSAHYADGGLPAAFLRERKGWPFTFTAHALGAQKWAMLRGVAPDEVLEEQYHFATRLAAERRAMAEAARIVVSTRLERLSQYDDPLYAGAVDPADANRFAVIPPGVNRHVFHPEPEVLDEAIRERIEAALARDVHPDQRQRPAVISVGRLERKKNLLGLVQAMATPDPSTGRRPSEQANLLVVVRGVENPWEEDLHGEEGMVWAQVRSAITSLGLSGCVCAFSLEGQAELAAAYRVLAGRLSVFCLPALFEPFGLAPLEAMACGLPAVATCHGGTAESMQEFGTAFGVLADTSDPAALAGALNQLLLSPDEWEYFHQAGLHRVAQRYTWEKTAEGYEAVFQEVLQGRQQVAFEGEGEVGQVVDR